MTSKTKLLFVAALTFSISLATTAFAQEGKITGEWVSVTGKLDDGTETKIYLQLEQNGTALSGRVVHPWGFLTVSEGQVEGRQFRFNQRMGDGFEFKTEGEVAGDELHYKATGWDKQWHEYVAHRVATGTGNPPPRIEPPTLHPVKANGLAMRPPMGWNSWNKFQNKVTDKVVREMADVIVATGMRDAGYVYINIDDTWEGQRDANGVLQPNSKFPDMKSLADYVHSKGLKLGIYSSPGPKTCAGYEGSYGHEELDAQTWAKWGIDYLKYDWCSAGKIYKPEDLQGVYQKMGEALVKSGRPIVYSLCEYGMRDVWKWGPQVGANLWRTTGDISDNWQSLARIGFEQGKLAPYASPGHWNDPDMLEIGNGGMTGDEYRTHMSLWAILAAPLLAGNDLRTMTPEIKSILMNAEVIAIDQDALGKAGQRVSQTGEGEIWMRPLNRNAYAVGLFNRGEAPAEMTLNLTDLKIPANLKARDLWAHQNVKLKDGKVSVQVPKHGVAFFKLSK